MKRKLTQDELARRVGAKGGRFTVIKWEQGLHKPTEYAVALTRELDLPEGLLDEDDSDEPVEHENTFLEAFRPFARLLAKERQ